MRELFVAGTTLLGAIVGGLVGVSVGYRESYVFQQAQSTQDSSGRRETATIERDDPFAAKKAFTIGIDLSSVFSRNTGSYSDGPGLTFRYVTAIPVKRELRGYGALGLEIDFSQINDYYPNVEYYYKSTIQHDYRYVVDERHRLSSGNIAVLPGYFFLLSDDVHLGSYVGAGFGLGAARDGLIVTSMSFVPAVPGRGSSDMSGLYGKNDAGRFLTVACGVVGASVYYKRGMVDLRYKYTDVNDGWNYKKFSLHIGFVL